MVQAAQCPSAVPGQIQNKEGRYLDRLRSRWCRGEQERQEERREKGVCLPVRGSRQDRIRGSGESVGEAARKNGWQRYIWEKVRERKEEKGLAAPVHYRTAVSAELGELAPRHYAVPKQY